ncbi:trypsin-like serine protease [Rhizoclosmatium globosum]|uniref:Trypsin-like serine protease n=1 Tax=Rhizoclosmatium globosum TaxID=329046 RepID=A0A1Y2CWY8_9FUNG|nr:trypsin-like serine protease [Rhizoclosmatium globosum]|eukprot:ORY51539.1 trypsin-like serine protease [Rhizoclosmatium globosum]
MSPTLKRQRIDAGAAETKRSEWSDSESEEALTGMDIDAEAGLLRSPSRTQWQTTIEKAIRSIVSLRFSQVAAFDTEHADTSEASGFVVDAKRGIILTNRHVACSGPFVGEAIFHNHEEVSVFPIYRDPVHDFGFLKFDPEKIKYMNVDEIALAPELAKVGLDIKVVGNDAGEKLSILSGQISPASSTSGGSSGSPVLEVGGRAVALQAGGRVGASTDFFFPLDRVKRCLELLQNDSPFYNLLSYSFRPFDECRRLGLQDETEAMIRASNPKEIGMLVCEVVVPKGPAFGFLEEGDVLISVDGVVMTKFVPLEAKLDESVGKEVLLKIERGGESMEFSVKVVDLHSITPDRYVEVGGAKVNNLSYQLARQFSVAVEGVYVSEPSGMFKFDSATDRGWIIESIDSKPCPNLDAFIEAIKGIPDRKRVPVTYYSIADVHTVNIVIVSMERHWTGFRLAVRNDKTGLWDFTNLGSPVPPQPIVPFTATFPELDDSLGATKDLFKSLVKISFYMPIRIDGYPKSRKQGAGLILDAERGIIVVGRNIVPFSMGDVHITFADTIIIPGKVLFLHPTHNLAFVSYDPKLIAQTPVRSAALSDVDLVQGHKVSFVAFNHNFRPVVVETTITDITSVMIPQNSTPRFRAINFDALTLDTPLAQQCSSGILADSQGRVQGLWLSFLGERNSNGGDVEYHMGMGISVIKPILTQLQQTALTNFLPAIKIRGLAAEFTPVQMAQAKNMGVSDAWIQKVEAANAHRRQLFMVRRVEAGGETGKYLKELDLILSIDGKTITRTKEVDVGLEWPDFVDIVLLRAKKEMTVRVPTELLDGEGTSRVVLWAGAIFQEPHRAVLHQSKTLPSRVYVSGRSKGSPSFMYGLGQTQWVTHINGTPTPDLDSFLEAVSKTEENAYVRVKTISFDNAPFVLSIKNNLHYFPTCKLERTSVGTLCGWTVVKKSDEGKK